MTLTTLDVLGLLALCVVFLIYAYAVWQTDRALRDPEHPDHEIAKEAIRESETRSTLDHWFRFE